MLLTQYHALDYLPWLVDKVESAWRFIAKLSDLEVDVEDTATIGLRFGVSTLFFLEIYPKTRLLKWGFL